MLASPKTFSLQPYASPLDRGLVGEWRFDPMTGALLPDYSGYGNDAAVTGATWVMTQYGPGLQFDSTDVAIANHRGMDKDLGTVAMYLRTDFASSSSDWEEFFDADTTRHVLYHYADTDSLRVYIDGYFTTFAVTWGAGEWHHIVYIWKKTGNVQRLFWDGKEVAGDGGAGSWGANAIGANIYIGNKTDASEPSLSTIVSTRLYDRALSATEAAELCEIAKTRRMQPTTPRYWEMLWGIEAAAAPAGIVVLRRRRM